MSISLLRMTRRVGLVICGVGGVISGLVYCGVAFGQDLDLINRPVNTYGLTGLIYTTSPFTLPDRIVEIGASALSENSLVPDYSLTEYPLTISMGINDSSEVAVRSSYFYRNTASIEKTRGMGDTDILYKWNCIHQPDTGNSPGVALILRATLPTSDRDAGVASVEHWGARAGIAAGSEIDFGEQVLGLYSDIQMAIQDQSTPGKRDTFYQYDAGLLFPISKNRNLQMLTEYNIVWGKDVVTVGGMDFSSFTYGLRLVNEQINITFGTQFIHKHYEGYQNSSRIAGTISFKM